MGKKNFRTFFTHEFIHFNFLTLKCGDIVWPSKSQVKSVMDFGQERQSSKHSKTHAGSLKGI